MRGQTERTRTTVRLNEALLDQAKALAEQKGTTLTALIEEGLRWAIAKDDQPRERIVLRTSSAGGDLRPGVDLNNSAQLWDLLDKEEGW
jgi:hypothetical protein